MRTLILGIVIQLVVNFSLFGQDKKSTEKSTSNSTGQLTNPSTTTTTNQTETEKEFIHDITFLNAANFDFTGTKNVSYLGKLSFNALSLSKSRWGFIGGIQRINFTFRDSTRSGFYKENRCIKPLDERKMGLKYLREYNKYENKLSNTAWSFYFQPTLRVLTQNSSIDANGQKRYGMFVHIHTELLVNKTNVVTTVSNLQRDTLVYDLTKPLGPIYYFNSNPIIRNNTILSGYFGTGITLNLDPFGNKKSEFFFQTTLGWTTNSLSWISQDIEIGINPDPKNPNNPLPVTPFGDGDSNSEGFYLFRSEFKHLFNSNVQLVIGTEIRGILPIYAPTYAAYTGLNLSLEKIADIFKGSN
jgi:hypothetical protein